MKRVAVVGSGIAGLAVAQGLAGRARVTLFEAGSHFGGHTHTVDVTLPGPRGQALTHGVDTGFLVFNHRTYPNLLRLFERLGVPTAPAEMSFSVQVPLSRRGRGRGLEWSGSDLNALFAQRRNLLSPRFLGMLAELLRFNRVATRLATSGSADALEEPLSDWLDRERFGVAFRDWYLLPMLGCIWSCPTALMLRFPVATMLRFCHNHGLLQVSDRPQWQTVAGGARQYVERMLEAIPDARLATPVRRVHAHDGGVVVATDAGSERFDDAVLACHAEQSLALLGAGASNAERAVLGAIRSQPNRAVLHTDTALLPRRRRAWAAWNYERAADAGTEQHSVCLHYLINRLQPLPWQQPVIVSLNPHPARLPQPEQVLASHDVRHPVFDAAAIRAQQALPQLQGQRRVWFCGAWTRYGFHEDGLVSGQELVARLDAAWAQRAEPAPLAA